ncbi:hypothetical protein HanXRQr2_Chr04g0185701 [Helianthus annuus]|uniref:Uncharacterized protein n=1 Tax=Helianthus annuus TaxID=4232 RepID=A0A251V2N2_HELAN|nr:hypothetical protein HanXRQr2_Chr04g0185701 [Helianthus annuus]KAJ0582429.1 hypothetical protein HanHA300_Chr04g0152151 [Helianthus annuus]KAJ0598411.1 hypothetical protein HanHA89_Chr04g0165511 [Helianthus annuus]KAJ0932928.1 hypothetical protein HanPSC8_Chr04g0179261 [Helianthus annuus]
MQLGFFLPATLPLLSAAPSFVSESDRHLHHKGMLYGSFVSVISFNRRLNLLLGGRK